MKKVNKQNPAVELLIHQPHSGYRFAEDSVLLSDFIEINSQEYLLDLCSGVGVIPLLLQKRCAFKGAIGVELQEELCQLALDNAAMNKLGGLIHFVRADVRNLTASVLQAEIPFECPDYFDVISVNPPYFQSGKGRLSPNPQRSAARHEICLSLPELFQTCHRFLRNEGRLYLVHLLAREAEIIRELRGQGFKKIARKVVHANILFIETHR